MYSNVDNVTNKMDELRARITVVDPDIVGLTEIKPKHPLGQYYLKNYISLVKHHL